MFAPGEEMITGTSLLHTHLQRFGMHMHVGSCATKTSAGSKSKTEAVYFSRREIPLFVKSKEFCYLGTIISSNLRDRPDIGWRINQASKACGSFCSHNPTNTNHAAGHQLSPHTSNTATHPPHHCPKQTSHQQQRVKLASP